MSHKYQAGDKVWVRTTVWDYYPNTWRRARYIGETSTGQPLVRMWGRTRSVRADHMTPRDGAR